MQILLSNYVEQCLPHIRVQDHKPRFNKVNFNSSYLVNCSMTFNSVNGGF